MGLPLASNQPLWIIDPKEANETAHVAYLTITTPISMQGPSASLVAFIVGYTRPPGVPKKNGNDIIGGGPMYLNFSAGATVKPTIINSGWTQYYDFTTVRARSMTVALMRFSKISRATNFPHTHFCSTAILTTHSLSLLAVFSLPIIRATPLILA